MTLEKLAEQIFKECEKDGEPVTKEEALEMARMEIGAKGIPREASATTTKDKPKKPKTVHISQEKEALFSTIYSNLVDTFGEDVQILTANKLISVRIGEKTFKIDVIEQRKLKK